MAKPKMDPAERMLASKKRLVKRLRGDIADVKENAEWNIQRIQSRINIAQTLIEALEKGTLKP